jgi:aconitase B
MEDLKIVKNELQNIIAGKVVQSQSNSIEAAKAYLVSYSQSSSKIKGTKPTKSNEEGALIKYTNINNSLLSKMI